MEGEGVRVIVIEKPSFLLPPEREWWPKQGIRGQPVTVTAAGWGSIAIAWQWTRLLPLKFVGSPLAGLCWGCCLIVSLF